MDVLSRSLLAWSEALDPFLHFGLPTDQPLPEWARKEWMDRVQGPIADAVWDKLKETPRYWYNNVTRGASGESHAISPRVFEGTIVPR